MQQKNCSVCAAAFTCGSDDGNCWCMEYPPVGTITEGQDCLCAACLKKTVEKALPASSATAADYYIENGLYVFTRHYHLKRGFCCKNGCRHCPY